MMARGSYYFYSPSPEKYLFPGFRFFLVKLLNIHDHDGLMVRNTESTLGLKPNLKVKKKQKRCPYCGALILNSEDKFCHKCMASLEEVDMSEDFSRQKEGF